MFALKNYQCTFCDSTADSKLFEDGFHRIIECPVCGRYVTNDSYIFHLKSNEKNCIPSYLFYNFNPKIVHYFGDEEFLKVLQKKNDNIIFFSHELKKQYLNISFSEKIDSFLMWSWNLCEYLGEEITISLDDFDKALFIKKYNYKGEFFSFDDLEKQRSIIIQYLEFDDDKKSYRYLEDINIDYKTKEITFKLSLKALRRIEENQKNLGYGKKVFIAMSFADGTQATRESIKKGIVNAGYEPILIDEVTHNHQIVPEMFKQIRESKFLVIDVTVPNNGAYYEAGYALGLGKEVIFCCKKETFDDTAKRPHFDVSQKQMIVWNNEAELTEKLTGWIKSLFD